MTVLNIDNATRTYRRRGADVVAVDRVSLTLQPGEFVAVAGPSGCGKSTLLLMAGGLLRPDSGRVSVGGEDVYALGGEGRARLRATRIGFVFQQFHLVPYLSVMDNVLAASLPTRLPNARERATGLLDHFGLSHRLTHTPGELSTGERQRTALARALLNGPELLLADEPTGNLDPDNAEGVLDHLGTFARSGGAVMLVTHDAGAAERADRVLRLREGRVEGSVAEQNEVVAASV